ARRHESWSSAGVGRRAISAYLSRYLALAGSQKLSGWNCAITFTGAAGTRSAIHSSTGRQWRAHPNLLPTREKDRCQAVELSPQRVFAAGGGIDLRGGSRGNAALSPAPAFRNVQVP